MSESVIRTEDLRRCYLRGPQEVRALDGVSLAAGYYPAARAAAVDPVEALRNE